jgi:hypothetical protein
MSHTEDIWVKKYLSQVNRSQSFESIKILGDKCL